MKTTILALLILAANTVIAQDSTMRMNTNNDGRIAARDMKGAAAPAALPLFETFVPQEAANVATSKYGKALYSIKQLRVASDDSAYQVALMESGQTRLEWIGGDGNIVTNIYRVDTGEMANQMNPNNNMAVTDTSMNNINNMNRDTAMRNMDNMNRDTSMRNMNNMNRDTSMRRDTMNMSRDTSMRNRNNMNRDTSMRNMNNRDTSMRRDTMNMGRDTSIRNMNNMNNRDTTRRDSMRLNGTSYNDIRYKMSEGGKPGEDLNIVLSKLSSPMKFVGDIKLIRRHIKTI
jgi:hypothetical protein